MIVELTEKLPITTELLNELITKSWSEIENIQTQLANLDNPTIKQLLKNLLTSYYVFVGGLENFQTSQTDENSFTTDNIEPVKEEDTKSAVSDKTDLVDFHLNSTQVLEALNEPFEYFIDFDEPVGEPISDEDLYGTTD